MLAGMNLNVAKEQKAEIVESLRRFAAEELDAEWSEVRAGFVLEYFLKEIGPLVYNHGVEDAQKFLRRAVEDLPATCFAEWKKAVAPGGRVSSTRTQQAEAIFQTENTRPSRERNPIAAYKNISNALGTRNKTL
jgi:uncharacterized protein (DUF2164 family)